MRTRDSFVFSSLFPFQQLLWGGCFFLVVSTSLFSVFFPFTHAQTLNMEDVVLKTLKQKINLDVKVGMVRFPPRHTHMR